MSSVERPTITDYPPCCRACVCAESFTDDFDRPDGPPGNFWTDLSDFYSPGFGPMAIIDNAVGPLVGRGALIQPEMAIPQGKVVEVVNVPDASIHFGTQFSCLAHGGLDFVDVDGFAVLDLAGPYYNILFSRYYLTCSTETNRIVLDGTPNALNHLGVHMLRTDGVQAECYVGDVRTNPPVAVPASLSGRRRFGLYNANAPLDIGDGIFDSCTIRCSDEPIGTPPPRPSIIGSTSTAVASGVGVTFTWGGGQPPVQIGDVMLIFVTMAGGGTIANTLAGFGSTTVTAQTTTSDGYATQVFQLRVSGAGLRDGLNAGTPLPWGKTGGVAGPFALSLVGVRNPNPTATVGPTSQSAAASSAVVASRNMTPDGNYRTGVWYVGCGPSPEVTITPPDGWTTVASVAPGSDVAQLVAIEPVDTPGLIDGVNNIVPTGAGALSGATPHNSGATTLPPNADLFT